LNAIKQLITSSTDCKLKLSLISLTRCVVASSFFKCIYG